MGHDLQVDDDLKPVPTKLRIESCLRKTLQTSQGQASKNVT